MLSEENTLMPYPNASMFFLKAILEDNTEKKQLQIGKLEATLKSLSAELLKVCSNTHLSFHDKDENDVLL